jgi:SNF2 family DNA or RNA helicase
MRNLEDLIRATCLRRTKEQVHGDLPLVPRVDKVELIDLNSSDRVVYEYFKAEAFTIASGGSFGREMQVSSSSNNTTSTDGAGSRSRKSQNIVCLINILRLICDHGETMLPKVALNAWESRGSDSVDWETMQKWNAKQCSICGQGASAAEDDERLAPLDAQGQFLCRHVFCPDCLLTERVEEEEGDAAVTCPTCGVDSVGSIQVVGQSSLVRLENGLRPPTISSNKVLALLRNIREEQRAGADFVTKR